MLAAKVPCSDDSDKDCDDKGWTRNPFQRAGRLEAGECLLDISERRLAARDLARCV